MLFFLCRNNGRFGGHEKGRGRKTEKSYNEKERKIVNIYVDTQHINLTKCFFIHFIVYLA